jgi:hypothetical protein
MTYKKIILVILLLMITIASCKNQPISPEDILKTGGQIMEIKADKIDTEKRCIQELRNDKYECIPYNSITAIPSGAMPLIIGNVLTLNGSIDNYINISFFNKQSTAIKEVIIHFKQCLSSEGSPVEPLTMVSQKTDIGAGESFRYTVKVEKTKLNPDNYICEVVAGQASDPNKIYESKDIFIKLI